MNFKCGKKKNAIIIVIGIVTVAICITAAVLVSRAKKKAAAAQFVSETETYSEETEEALFGEETVSETESETTPAAETEHNAHKAFKRTVYRPEKKISHRL